MNIKHHQQALKDTFIQFKRNRWSNIFTLLVIGVALALPLTLGVILNNLQEIARGWDVGNQMTIYLKDTASTHDAQALVTQLQKHQGVEKVDYLSAEQTLQQFRERSGFAEALSLLPENPLPAIVVVHPKSNVVTEAEMAQWAQQLQRLPTVELVQLDQEWLQRLAGLIKVADRGIWILSSLLLIAVALVIGNTIRLMIQNRQDEIALVDLMGATRSFVRRPFLYMGILFGFGGGLLACLLVTFALFTLQRPVADVASLYNSTFFLTHMTPLQILIVLICSALAGWTSAYVVVTHYLFGLLPKK